MGDNDILWFYVPVEDFVLVKVPNSFEDLFDNESRGLLAKLLLLFEEPIELPVASQLLEQVQVLLIIEVAIHGDDIGMADKRADLDFPEHLGHELLLLNPVLLDGFHGVEEPRPPMADHHHVAELALADVPDHLEIG